MTDLKSGLYQSVLTEALVKHLQKLDPTLTPKQSYLHRTEVADRLAMHVAKVIQTAIAGIDETERVELGGNLTQRLIQLLAESTSNQDLFMEQLVLPPRILDAIEDKDPMVQII